MNLRSLRIASVAFLVGMFMWSTPATATGEPGLSVEVYTYDPSALPDRVPYTLCKETIETAWTFTSQLADDWGGDVVAGCRGDFVLLHYRGYITMPESGSVTFQSYADDGFFMSIGGQTVIDNWWLKGCSGGTGVAQFEAGVSQVFDAWFYEYGGGACNELYTVDTATGSQQLVPASAFSQDPVVAPSPSDTPTPLPSDSPVTLPSDLPTPTPSDTPEPTPSPSETLIESPTPTPSPSDIPTPTPSPSDVAVVPSVAPIQPSVAPTPAPTLEQLVNEAAPTPNPTNILPPPVTVTLSPSLARIPGAKQIAAAVAQFLNIGNDMTPAQRKKAQQVAVSAVVVTQIASVKRIKK